MLVPIKDPTLVIEAVLNSLNCPNTRTAYSRALYRYSAWCQSNGNPPLNRQTVTTWKQSLQDEGCGSATVNLFLSALRKMADEAYLMGWCDESVAASVARVEGIPRKGRRTGNWMNLDTAKKLIATPDDSLSGKRDSAVIALLLGAALRRSEATGVTVEQFQQRDGHWLLVDIIGKGNRVASVALAPWAADRIAAWIKAAGITTGHILRRVDRGTVGERLSHSGVAWIVSKYSQLTGVKLACHDYRRSAATLAKKGNASWESVRDFLRHSSVTTTEKYVKTTLITEDPASQRMGL